MNKYKIFGITILGLLIAFSPVLQLGFGQDTPRNGGTLRIGAKTDPSFWVGALDPFNTAVTTKVFDRLVTYDNNFNLVPQLAKELVISSDRRTFTFNLHNNVTWHDGEPFTSADVKFTFELAGNLIPGLLEKRAYAATWLIDGYGLQSIETPDDYTVIFKFEKPALAAQFANINSDILIVPKHKFDIGVPVAENPASQNPIGTGPWKFVEQERGSHIILEANDDYFLGRPYLDTLVFRNIKDNKVALLALEAGEIDVVTSYLGLPLPDMPRIMSSEKLNGAVWAGAGAHQQMRFNFRQEALDKHPWVGDIRVREAFYYAINEDQLLKQLYLGLNPLQWGPIGVESPYHNQNLPPYPSFDPERAEALLDEAGYPRGDDGVRFRFKAPTTSAFADMTVLIEDDLRKVGIEWERMVVERSTFLATYERGVDGLADFPLGVFTGVRGVKDPEFMRSQWDSHYTNDKGGINVGWYKNEKVDQLFEAGVTATTFEERKPIYDQLQEEMIKDLPSIWITAYNRIQAWSTDFEGFPAKPLEFNANYLKVWWTKGEVKEIVSSAPWPDSTSILAGLLIGLVVGAGIVYASKRRKSD